MTRDDWARVEALFDEARQRPRSDRDAWLRTSGADDATIALVARMLVSYDTDPQFLEQPVDATSVVEAATADHLIGRRLGRYRIVGVRGRGGTGIVYEAVRDDDEFSRRVAIKVLPAWTSADVADRFKFERRVLASLDHPGIARLIDSGTTDDGALYFVMEFVDGVPIDAWCTRQQLDVPSRVALLHRVAEVVAYAHQHLVVHRDLKPANIFVDKDGHPKLLDFGIATVLSMEGAPSDGLTLTGRHSFTLEFASPEQVRGEPVTTASDVYALGIVLFLLLTGKRPYALHGLSPLEAMRTICEVDPPLPSAVATSSDAPRLRGGLDAVVMKALCKAPSDRYPTVAAMADDLRAWGLGLPVSAAPESFAQRAKRFVRRHRLAVGATSLVVLSIVIGGGMAVWQARVARQERARADQRFNELRKLANAVVGPLYDEIAKVPASTAARKALVTEALAYLDGLEAQAADDVALKVELADAYQKLGDVQGNQFFANLGDAAGAKSSYDRMIRLRREVAAARPGDAVAQVGLSHAETRMADTALQENRLDEAMAGYERALAFLVPVPATFDERITAENRARTDYASALMNAGRHAEAEAQFRQLSTVIEPWASGRDASETKRRIRLALRSNLVEVLYYQGRLSEALIVAREAVALSRDFQAAATDQATARFYLYRTLNRLGVVLYGLQQLDEAIEAWAESTTILERMAEADPKNARMQFDLAGLYQGLAQFHVEKKRPDPAAQAIARSLKIWTATLSAAPEHKTERFNYGMALTVLAAVENMRGNLSAAAAAYRQALDVYSDPVVVARSPSDRWEIYENLGDLLMKRARAGGASDLRREASEAYTAARDGYAGMARAGTLPQALTAKPDEVDRKLRQLSTGSIR